MLLGTAGGVRRALWAVLSLLVIARVPRPWRFAPAAAVTLLTGGVMMSGGYLFANRGWAVAGWVMTPAGPLISVAFALARKARGRGPDPRRADRVRHITTLLVGMPSPGGNIGPVASAATTAAALLAGAVMVVAGYALARWNPLLVPPIAVAGGIAITAAFVIADRSEHKPERATACPPATGR